MRKIAIAIHGGANSGSPFLDENRTLYEAGLRTAVEAGYRVLEGGGTATDAVEAAVVLLEDNPLFNAGRGSALNKDGEVEMDAAVMQGTDLAVGAVAMVRQIRNPISLARAVMRSGEFVFLGAEAAQEYAIRANVAFKESQYFITDRQYLAYRAQAEHTDVVSQRGHGTVGAVALDYYGNVAAGTSTGGTPFKQPGRIGDSCVIGAGCYANNRTCAVSATGDGEVIIRYTLAHEISAVMEYTGRSLQAACDYVFGQKYKEKEGDMGVIAVDAEGEVVFAFNTRCMCRAKKCSDGPVDVQLYQT